MNTRALWRPLVSSLVTSGPSGYFSSNVALSSTAYWYSYLTRCFSCIYPVQAKNLGKEVIVTPEQIAATLLTKIKSVCEMNMDGQKVKDCVIAVPHFFTDVQRRSILDAAKIAGLNPLRLINETTAIALQYGTGRPITEARKVCFYDMGVSSTDVSIVTISGQGLKVEAVASDRNLGGRVIDEILAEYLAVQIKDKYKLDVASNQKAWLKLRKEADRVKQYLSANTKVPYAKSPICLTSSFDLRVLF